MGVVKDLTKIQDVNKPKMISLGEPQLYVPSR